MSIEKPVSIDVTVCKLFTFYRRQEITVT